MPNDRVQLPAALRERHPWQWLRARPVSCNDWLSRRRPDPRPRTVRPSLATRQLSWTRSLSRLRGRLNPATRRPAAGVRPPPAPWRT